jgi:hypothetical protein
MSPELQEAKFKIRTMRRFLKSMKFIEARYICIIPLSPKWISAKQKPRYSVLSKSFYIIKPVRLVPKKIIKIKGRKDASTWNNPFREKERIFG